MFKAYDFTFAGQSASMFGLSVCDIGSSKHSDNPFGNIAEIAEERIAQRISPLHFGVNYHSKPLTFHLIFAADKYVDRFDMQAVAKWLTGHQQYQWLTIDQPDLAHVQFRCLVTSLTPISVAWHPIAFDAEITCDCPYAYSYPFEKTFTVNGSNVPIKFYNDSTCRELLRPHLQIELSSGCTELIIKNQSNGGRETKLTGLPGGALSISLDNETCVMQETSAVPELDDLYKYFNFKFFELVSGDNDLLVTGNATITVSGRYLYNVGA